MRYLDKTNTLLGLRITIYMKTVADSMIIQNFVQTPMSLFFDLGLYLV